MALLNDLLDSAKIEAGKLELEAAPFSLRRIFDETAQVLGVRASEKGIAFSCRIRPDVPDLLVGDQLRLRQVLLNLAGNGIKFTESGEVSISVEPTPTADVGADISASGIANPRSEISDLGSEISDLSSPICHLKFAVRDTGIGLSAGGLEAHLSAVWTGRRLNRPSLRRDRPGIDDLLQPGGPDGRPDLGPERSGARQHVLFHGSLAAGHGTAPRGRNARRWRDGRGATRILLAEDNPANQKLATFILQSRGHTVDIAGDGEQALRMTQESRYDILLMDVQMPGMDGLEATAAIRKCEAGSCHVPIIAMTAHAMKEDRERCLAAGMDGYLAKPIDAREMIALVETLAAASHAAAVGAMGLSPGQEQRGTTRDGSLRSGVGPETVPRATGSARPIDPALHRGHGSVIAENACGTQRDDFLEVRNLGHRLAGTLAYLAAEPARQAARRMERVGVSGGGQAEAEEAVATLERECRALRNALAEHQAAAGQGTTAPSSP